jgi:Fic family protein
MAYRPKFTVTQRLSAHLAGIAATRRKFLRAERQPSSDCFPKAQRQGRVQDIGWSLGTEGKQPFTLERIRALANGEDFPVITESRGKDVLQYFAMRYRRETTSVEGNWTHRDVLRLHKLVASGEGMDQGFAGRYRSIGVRTRGLVPPAPGDVPRLMFELLEWWNTKARTLPTVLTSAILHYRISDIHPCADGNGRLARALALWELYRGGFGRYPTLSLNGPYWGTRRQYYAALRAVSRRGEDLTSWLEYSAQRLKLELRKGLRS